MKYLAKFIETNCKEVLIEGKSQAEAKKKFFEHGFKEKNVRLRSDELELIELNEVEC